MIENNPFLFDALWAWGRMRDAIMAPSLPDALKSKGGCCNRWLERSLRSRQVRRIVHRNCGQLCGQLTCAGPQAAQIQAMTQIAQNLGKKNPLKINDLYDYESRVTVEPPNGALWRVLVEFSGRAVPGFARD